MRFFILGAAVSALAGVSAGVPFDGGKLTLDESVHMKDQIMSLAKSTKTDNCEVAQKQVKCLHELVDDYAMEGNIEGEKVSATEGSSSRHTAAQRV